MKQGIHPNYEQTTIRCACGAVYHTGSTKKDITENTASTKNSKKGSSFRMILFFNPQPAHPDWLFYQRKTGEKHRNYGKTARKSSAGGTGGIQHG